MIKGTIKKDPVWTILYGIMTSFQKIRFHAAPTYCKYKLSCLGKCSDFQASCKTFGPGYLRGICVC